MPRKICYELKLKVKVDFEVAEREVREAGGGDSYRIAFDSEGEEFEFVASQISEMLKAYNALHVCEVDIVSRSEEA